MKQAQIDLIKRLLAQSSGQAQAELNRIAMSLGLITGCTDAATVNARLRRHIAA